MTPPPAQFGRVPHDLIVTGSLAASGVDRIALLVLLGIAAHVDESFKSYPSMDTLAQCAGVTTRSARRAIRRLEARGIIEVEQVRGRSKTSTYTIIPDAHGVLFSTEKTGRPERPGNTEKTGRLDAENRTPTDLKPDANASKTGRPERPPNRGTDEQIEQMRAHTGKKPVVEATLPDIATPPASEEAGSAIVFPTQDGRDWPLTPDRLAEYAHTFPDLNVLHELRKARLWLLDNPDRRKTARGMPKYLTGWLGRAHPASDTYGDKVPGDVLDRICPPTEPTDEDLREAYR
ncbi:MAG: helix-turn-helix domain-containing protein [Phycisphaeraceae bacterium]